MIMHHDLEDCVNEPKLVAFLHEIQSGYIKEVPYHNDLHGIDVAHMAHLMLIQGHLVHLLELEKIDVLAFLIAGMCHDLGHDGFTNGYHVNTLSERAIRYNDLSV